MKPIPETLASTVGQRVDLIDTPALVVDHVGSEHSSQRIAGSARKQQ